MLEPERNEIEKFVTGVFRHAGTDGYVSLRAFYEDDSTRPFRITPIKMVGGLPFLVDAAEDDARRAANHPRKIVFCPPLAVFRSRNGAKEPDIIAGLALSVECDERPREAVFRLEQVLGPATFVVRSGGTWTDPANGQVYDKLHAHWVLESPARSDNDITKLRQARDLAARLVGGDPSNKPVCHPIRMPGSWHRKSEPRRCEIETETKNEIDLNIALAALKAASGMSASGAKANGHSGANPFSAYGANTRIDDEDLEQKVIDGREVHNSIIRLAARYVTGGMSDDEAMAKLYAVMDAATWERDARWHARRGEIERAVKSAREKFDAKREQEKADDAATAAERKRRLAIPLTYFGALEKARPKPALIKNVLYRGEVSSWIGPPGSGKSGLLTDIAVHLAAGEDWRDHLVKAAAGVVYFALERGDLVKRRLTAHRLRDKLKTDLPIAVASHVIDLLKPTCVEIIVATVEQAEEHFGSKAGLLIIDTYSKGIAAGGGDENSAKDQNIAAANLRRVIERLNVHIAGVGHTGKDEGRGERGSNARVADTDAQMQISGDLVKVVTVTKANDQPLGVLTAYGLEPFDFKPDEDGEVFRTYIVSEKLHDVSNGGASRQRLSDRQCNALDALTEAVLTRGRQAPPSFQLPHDIKVVTDDEWKAELVRNGSLKADGKSTRYDELRAALQARHLIGVRDGFVWHARKIVP
jgi:hypothetical protein